MNKQQREQYTQKLAQVISTAMVKDEHLRKIAILEGRVGLDDLHDEALIEFGKKYWGVPFEG